MISTELFFKRFYFKENIDPDILVIGLCIISFILQFRFIFASDIAYLAADWVKDDAFYYLQPAWQFKQFGFFTFDGINPTYGFHPLWMIIVSLLAAVTSDKAFFFREILFFSSVLCSGVYSVSTDASSHVWELLHSSKSDLVIQYGFDLCVCFRKRKCFVCDSSIMGSAFIIQV